MRALSWPLRGLTATPLPWVWVLICPKLSPPNVCPGIPRLGWLSALTQSDRNWRRTRSPNRKSLAIDRFNTEREGPRREFLRSFPNAKGTPDPFTQASAKAAVLNHSFGFGLLT